MAPALGQTISVMDKSGKVVSTSKHIFGVFKEARSAYRERKAELQAHQQARFVQEEETRRALAEYTLDDSRTVASRRSRSHRSHHHSPRHYEQDLVSNASSHRSRHPPRGALARRHTSHELAIAEHPTTVYKRSHSHPHVDMDLAYGEFHEASLMPKPHAPPEDELNGLVHKAKMLLDEADCAQHSAIATIKHLQKNPDAMAAVALTLAEISNVAAKMAPSVLTALKSSAPSVFALLASPQFMIAAGVGLGVTVVMFGGYKIIQRIQAAKNDREIAQAGMAPSYDVEEPGMDEMMELRSEIGSIESWRRGVADVEANSLGTSVDGEFITPTAAAMSGIVPRDALTEVRSVKSSKSKKYNDTASRASSRKSKSSSTKGDGEKKKEKKKSSPLRFMFTV